MIITLADQFFNRLYLETSYKNSSRTYVLTVYKNPSIKGYILAFTNAIPYLSTADTYDLISIVNIPDSLNENKEVQFELEGVLTNISITDTEISVV